MLTHLDQASDEAPALCRELFPATSRCAYLDTGSAGLAFPGHGRAVSEFFEAKSRGYVARETWQAKAASVRQTLANWLAVPAGEIDFFSGTTDALNIVGHSIDWRRGDEIVVASDEFPSVRLAWEGALRAGATVRQIEIASEAEREEALLAALTPRTRALVAAHVHSMAGTRLDLDRLGAACRERDILFIVDGIHALGATPVSLAHVDVYVSGVFKWLLAGFGVAVCVIREGARARMRQAFRGYLNQSPEDGLQFAHVNYPGLYALGASLELMGETLGWDLVQSRTEQLVSWLAEELEAGGITIAAPKGARAGIASIPVANADAARLDLAERQIFAAARGPYLRVTPFFYNSREDVHRLARHVLAHR